MFYKKFEDMKIWQDSRSLVNKVYKLISNNDRLKRDFSLCDQLKRASYSIMLNIAEGFERRSKKEFANFLNIAKGSAGEVRSILYVIKDNYSIEETEFSSLIKDVEAIAAQLFNFRKFLVQK
jgi:four helix bundle protein